MNITPRVKSARNRNNLIVNVSIEIPLPHKYPPTQRSNQHSLTPSPNRLKKKYKLTITPANQKKTMNTSNLNTLRDLPPPEMGPSRRKTNNNPTPALSKQLGNKFKSCELSPQRKSQTSRRGKEQKKIVRTISILQQVVNEQDNMIKYTTNSNQLRERVEERSGESSMKVYTHISEVDIVDMRRIEKQVRDGRESQYSIRANDILRTACAKKIQRAWKNYKTKKLIKSYSNDIRHKYSKNLMQSDDPMLSVRSQGGSLKFKKTLPGEEVIIGKPKSKIVKQFQEQNIQKWQDIIQQIKQGKNIQNVLEKSLKRSEELKSELGWQKQRGEMGIQVDEIDYSKAEKIIKTKTYYEKEREKRRDNIERSGGSIVRQERVQYFQNQLQNLENDLSDISLDSAVVNSFDCENCAGNEELQNIKLRKKLQIFKNHLPDINSNPRDIVADGIALSGLNSHPEKRIDIATIMRKKLQSNNAQVAQTKIQQKPKEMIGTDAQSKHTKYFQQSLQSIAEKVQRDPFLANSKSSQRIQFMECDSMVQAELQSLSEQFNIETYRQWKPTIQIQQKQDQNWKTRLKKLLKQKDQQMQKSVLQQLILQSMIQISQSQKLIAFIKQIYDQSKTKKKPQGIVTSHSSIKDYLNYFIHYLYEYKMDQQIFRNLMKPVGPSAEDVLKYFRGEDLLYDPDSEYVMSIKMFNQHWEYANQLIYFDPKWEDQKKETDRVNYLKQLTKVFFRAIFDCFNESLQAQRIYGQRGKPYPWSQQKLKIAQPTLQSALSSSFHRVIKCSMVFCGVHFIDKQHNLDQHSMDEVQEQNMVNLISIELGQDECLWNFYEDELVEIKLLIGDYVEQVLLKEVLHLVLFGLERKKI